VISRYPYQSRAWGRTLATEKLRLLLCPPDAETLRVCRATKLDGDADAGSEPVPASIELQPCAWREIPVIHMTGARPAGRETRDFRCLCVLRAGTRGVIIQRADRSSLASMVP
jgi:hypothetical protein